MTHLTGSVLQEKLKDRNWRLSNLYYITDKRGSKVLFKPNAAQFVLLQDMHYRNVILKARQLGFSTFIQIFTLDACLFRSDTKAGLVAHALNDATEIFDSKICYPYDNLPEALKEWRPAIKRTATRIEFSNGSSIRVGTSMRSGTVQILHVSEFGKIAATRPDKAQEILTGALEAVPMDGLAFFESTAEGMGGHFYDMVQTALKKQQAGSALTPLDLKLFFFPWFQNPEYTLAPEYIDGVVITPEQGRYFAALESEVGITLSAGQKAWYVKKEETNEDDMRREYPGTVEEAFKGSVQGAYYSQQMANMRKHGRITKVPYNPAYGVQTWWDLGYNDYMAVWAMQQVGKEWHGINYYECNGEVFAHYLQKLTEWSDEYGYVYEHHITPHDDAVHELTNENNESRAEYLQRKGMHPIITADRPKNNKEVQAQIQLVREFLPSVWLDEEKCADGINALDNFKKKWDDRNGVFSNEPARTEAKHGADAFRTGVVGFKVKPVTKARSKRGRGRAGEFRL